MVGYSVAGQEWCNWSRW